MTDNRLLPRGWTSDHPHGADIAPTGVRDPDFTGGRDEFICAIPIGSSEGPWTVEATLLYQVLGARFARELFRFDTAEMRAFSAYYASADRTPETVAEARLTLSAPE
jgi:hypothetical protein